MEESFWKIASLLAFRLSLACFCERRQKSDRVSLNVRTGLCWLQSNSTVNFLIVFKTLWVL